MIFRTARIGLLSILAVLASCSPSVSKVPKFDDAVPSAARMAAMPGMKVGEKLPIDMALQDSAGRATSLGQQMGTKGLVLVLVRSADWCPFCQAQLIELKDVQAQVEQRGYKLASLSYDKPEVLATFIQKRGIQYGMISDTGSKMIDAAGLRDPDYKGDKDSDGIPRASVLVIGVDGTLKSKNVTTDYKIRASNSAVLLMVDGSS